VNRSLYSIGAAVALPRERGAIIQITRRPVNPFLDPPAPASRRTPAPSPIATFLVPRAERTQVLRARADTGV
jgi:hypothetical protein